MPLSDFIQIAISIDSIGIARAGFGILLILSANATYPERVRFYTDTAGLAADWATDSPEYLAGVAALSQGDPKPSAIAIGRTIAKPTMTYRLAVATLTDSTAYKVRARGPGVTDTTATATSAAPATLEGTHNALLGAVNGVTGKNFTATFAPMTFTPAVFTVDNTTDIFTITAHGLFTGDGPFQATNTGGALPSGLLALTDYYIVKLTANTFKLATTRALALAGTPDVNVTTNGTGTQTLSGNVPLSPTTGIDVTGNAAGNWFSLEILDTNGLSTSLASTYLSNAMTHADPGVATDLNNIAAENSSFYLVYPLYPSTAYGLGVMAWVESTGTSDTTGPKVCIIDTCDSHTITAAAGGNDIGDQAKAASYDRTLLEYHPSPIDFLGAALAGAVLPLDPGSETWAFKPLNGPRGVNLSATHRANLRARNMNTYEPQTPDLTWTWDGKTPGGEFFDTVRGLDFVRDDASKSIAEVLANNPKVPYTDGGALTLGNELEGVFARAVTAQIFAEDPAPKVTIPRVKTQTSANRRARKFAGLKGSATLAGAIQDVGPVSIIVTQ